MKGRGPKFMVDVDLSILGEDPHTYWKYEHAIRREYGFVPEDVYLSERIKILRRFEAKEHVDALYRTPIFKGRFNNQARQNLAHALAYLENFTSPERTSTGPALDPPSPPAA